MKPGLPRHLTRVVRALSKSQKCSPEVFCQRHPNFGLKSRSLRKQVAFFRVHGCIQQDGRLDPPPRPTVMSPRICALLAVLSEIFEGSFVPKILSALFLSAPSKLQGLTIPSGRSIAELSSTLNLVRNSSAPQVLTMWWIPKTSGFGSGFSSALTTRALSLSAGCALASPPKDRRYQIASLRHCNTTWTAEPFGPDGSNGPVRSRSRKPRYDLQRHSRHSGYPKPIISRRRSQNEQSC